MTLTSGTLLGPYEVVAPLGAGGMGEVYRASDSRLDREVAIKVLPSELSLDRDLLLRFQQEARSASSLNHPNIVTVHDIGEHEGAPFIAMELVDGKSLRELLSTGARSMRRVLPIAEQLASGLAAAHERGIVHRDLKPENIMVTRDGLVKILDFGLAKLVKEMPEPGDPMRTAVDTRTRPGMVVGTIGYMSPEQASGQSVDFRSDQFALGAILYEAVTGKRAFQRSTAVDTLAAIIHEHPEPISAIEPKVPAPFRWLIDRCLSKEPADRYASTRDLARDLQLLREHLSDPATLTGTMTAASPARRRRFAAGAAGAALAAAALGLFAGREIGKAPLPSFHQLTFRRGFVQTARFAPDGSTIAYGAGWEGNPLQLFAARTDSAEWRSLGLPDGDVLSVSPTGEMALSLGRHFLSAHLSTGTLAQAPLAGGASREIAEGVQEADWDAKGEKLAIVRRVEGRHRLEYPSGKVLVETDGWIGNVRVSPRGDRIGFLDHPLYGDDRGTVAFVDLAGKKTTLGSTWASAQGLAWTPDGEEIWFTGSGRSRRELYAADLKGRIRTVATLPGLLTIQDMSKTGGVLLTIGEARAGIRAAASDGSRERDLSWFNWSTAPNLSADGKTLLFSEAGGISSAFYDIYLRKVDGSLAVRLGEGKAEALSPDGKWALATVLASPPRLVALPTGIGEPLPLTVPGYEYSAADWFPDGKKVLFEAKLSGTRQRLFVQEIPSGKPRPITPEGVKIDYCSHPIAPDGGGVVARNPDGSVSVYPVAGGAPRPVTGLLPGDQIIRWSKDGRSLYLLHTGELPARIWALEVSSGKRTLWKEIVPGDPTGVVAINPIDVAPDGAHLVYRYNGIQSNLYLVDGLR